MQVFNNSKVALSARPATSRCTTPKATSTRRSCPTSANLFAYRAGTIVPAAGQLAAAGHGGRQRRYPGPAAALQDPGRLARQPARSRIKIVDPRTRRRRPRPSSTSSLSQRERLQSRFEHFARDRRRGVPAGAVFDEQHADGDARVHRGREGRKPGVGVARFAGRPAAFLARFAVDCAPASPCGERTVAVFSSAVPVLPATVTPGIAAEVPVPSRTTPIIRWRTVRATAGAHRRARRGAGALGQ